MRAAFFHFVLLTTGSGLMVDHGHHAHQVAAADVAQSPFGARAAAAKHAVHGVHHKQTRLGAMVKRYVKAVTAEERKLANSVRAIEEHIAHDVLHAAHVVANSTLRALASTGCREAKDTVEHHVKHHGNKTGGSNAAPTQEKTQAKDTVEHHVKHHGNKTGGSNAAPTQEKTQAEGKLHHQQANGKLHQETDAGQAEGKLHHQQANGKLHQETDAGQGDVVTPIAKKVEAKTEGDVGSPIEKVEANNAKVRKESALQVAKDICGATFEFDADSQDVQTRLAKPDVSLEASLIKELPGCKLAMACSIAFASDHGKEELAKGVHDYKIINMGEWVDQSWDATCKELATEHRKCSEYISSTAKVEGKGGLRWWIAQAFPNFLKTKGNAQAREMLEKMMDVKARADAFEGADAYDGGCKAVRRYTKVPGEARCVPIYGIYDSHRTYLEWGLQHLRPLKKLPEDVASIYPYGQRDELHREVCQKMFAETMCTYGKSGF